MGKKRGSADELFSGIKICVTAISLQDRKAVQRATQECGGIYSADLDQSCTHLLVGEPKGAKFDMAVTWQMKTVSPAWFWDSIEEGLLLPISRYAITKPVENVPSQQPTHFANMRCVASKQIESIYGDKVKEMVTEGGGTYSDTFDAATTHYIVVRGDVEPEDEAKLLKHASWRPTLVRMAWLRACSASKTRLPLTGYEVTPPLYPQLADVKPKMADVAPSRQFLNGIGQHTDNIVISKKRKTQEEEEVRVTADPEVISTRSRQGLHAFEPILSVNQPAKKDGHRRSRTFETEAAEASRSAWEMISRTDIDEEKTTPVDELFKDLTFYFQDFEEDKRAVLASIVRSHSGRVVAAWHRKQDPHIDYLVVPWKSRPIFGLSVKIITECWITRCDQDHRILPIGDHLLFTPLDIAYPISDFAQFLISVTGYVGLDREWVFLLSTLLGARFSDRMTKDTTHLICASPEGNKYTKAVQWQIPTVNIDWLYDSAVHGYAMPIKNHPVQGAMQPPDDQKALAKKRHEKGEQDAKKNKENVVTPRNVLNTLTEEDGPVASSVGSTRAVCGTTARKVHPHQAMLYGQEASPMESPSLLQNTRLRSKKLATPPKPILDQLYSERVVHGPQDRPLQHCRISLSTRASSRRSEILTLCDQLGALFLGAYDASCTHLIHIGTAAETVEPKDFKQAKANKKHIVHPDWLHKCVDLGRVAPEDRFPYHYLTAKTPEHRQPTTLEKNSPSVTTRRGRPKKNAPLPAGLDPRNPIFMASQHALL